MATQKIDRSILPSGTKVENGGTSVQGRLSASEWNTLVNAVGLLIDALGRQTVDVTEAELAELEKAGLLEEGTTYMIYES